MNMTNSIGTLPPVESGRVAPARSDYEEAVIFKATTAECQRRAAAEAVIAELAKGVSARVQAAIHDLSAIRVSASSEVLRDGLTEAIERLEQFQAATADDYAVPLGGAIDDLPSQAEIEEEMDR